MLLHGNIVLLLYIIHLGYFPIYGYFPKDMENAVNTNGRQDINKLIQSDE